MEHLFVIKTPSARKKITIQKMLTEILVDSFVGILLETRTIPTKKGVRIEYGDFYTTITKEELNKLRGI